MSVNSDLIYITHYNPNSTVYVLSGTLSSIIKSSVLLTFASLPSQFANYTGRIKPGISYDGTNTSVAVVMPGSAGSSTAAPLNKLVLLSGSSTAVIKTSLSIGLYEEEWTVDYYGHSPPSGFIKNIRAQSTTDISYDGQGTVYNDVSLSYKDYVEQDPVTGLYDNFRLVGSTFKWKRSSGQFTSTLKASSTARSLIDYYQSPNYPGTPYYGYDSVRARKFENVTSLKGISYDGKNLLFTDTKTLDYVNANNKLTLMSGLFSTVIKSSLIDKTYLGGNFYGITGYANDTIGVIVSGAYAKIIVARGKFTTTIRESHVTTILANAVNSPNDVNIELMKIKYRLFNWPAVKASVLRAFVLIGSN